MSRNGTRVSNSSNTRAFEAFWVASSRAWFAASPCQRIASAHCRAPSAARASWLAASGRSASASRG